MVEQVCPARDRDHDLNASVSLPDPGLQPGQHHLVVIYDGEPERGSAHRVPGQFCLSCHAFESGTNHARSRGAIRPDGSIASRASAMSIVAESASTAAPRRLAAAMTSAFRAAAAAADPVATTVSVADEGPYGDSTAGSSSLRMRASPGTRATET